MGYVIYPNPVLSGGQVQLINNLLKHSSVTLVTMEGKIIPVALVDDQFQAPITPGVYLLVFNNVKLRLVVI